VEMATSASPGYAALTSGRHQLSGIARLSAATVIFEFDTESLEFPYDPTLRRPPK